MYESIIYKLQNCTPSCKVGFHVLFILLVGFAIATIMWLLAQQLEVAPKPPKVCASWRVALDI